MWNIQKRIIKILEKKQPSTLNFLKNSKCWAVFSIFFFIPYILFAQIEITEIMYDLEGDDDGPDNKQRREWIEIYNSGDNIDLKDWKLYEAKTNHGIDSVPEGGDVFYHPIVMLL